MFQQANHRQRFRDNFHGKENPTADGERNDDGRPRHFVALVVSFLF